MPFPLLPIFFAQIKTDIATQNEQIHLQATAIPVYAFPFHSPYQGKNSLPSDRQVAISQTTTLFLGQRLSKGLELYVDPESTRGVGLGSGYGLAGAPNTEVIHTSASKYPYWARAFLRWTVPTQSHGTFKPVEDGQNQLAGPRPEERLVITAGKMSTADLFDTNSYANSPRSQFLNLDLVNSPAYDYAADVRGYSIGTAVEYYGNNYAVRLGAFQMPEVANGETLDGNFAKAQGDQLEFEFHPQLAKKAAPSVFRVLGYLNHARMGSYSEALRIASQTGSTPDVAATDAPGRFKYGINLNFEQPIADDGDTGVFARFGANDGKTESYVYSEAEASFSLGAQVSGARFKMPQDRFGIGLAINGLGKDHRAYLEAGGVGFQIGDGRLTYGTEQLIEAYFLHTLAKGATVSLDLQGIQNPGYNRDRGPVFIAAVRFHFEI